MVVGTETIREVETIEIVDEGDHEVVAQNVEGIRLDHVTRLQNSVTKASAEYLFLEGASLSNPCLGYVLFSHISLN